MVRPLSRTRTTVVAATTALSLGLGCGLAAADEPELKPNVPPYASPGLSSAPSSGQPGLIWNARGLSSKMIDPIKGYKGVLIGIAVAYFSLSYARIIIDATNRERIARGEQPLPVPTLDTGSAREAGQALSSQLTLPPVNLPPLPGR
ncbi:hypothetical protein ACFSSC_07610 [Corynebacterium mendelii]|uniref:Uncharacterized protein n=1 Tax=Corynebacterium mendelii TaxID=2765362 RepID=A0A939E1L2_9CORY|nr:hypothetical protein [Corynebacterium mendelii]MBN9644801.1 hypothetical protein [Corynebacterium mendelii]